MSGAVLARIPAEGYSDYRYEAIFRAYKWDPQVEDHNTVAGYGALLDRETARQLELWAEELSAETMEIEGAIVGAARSDKKAGTSFKGKKGHLQNGRRFP